MAFILDQQRSADCVGAFERYRAYLSSVRSDFPRSAFELATSDWYFSGDDARSPHDARLNCITIAELAEHTRSGPRPVSIRIKLLLAADNRSAEFFYPEVFSYRLNARLDFGGHCDWRYDEFRLSASGRVIHEIEWCRATETGRWVIEASDVDFTIQES